MMSSIPITDQDKANATVPNEIKGGIDIQEIEMQNKEIHTAAGQNVKDLQQPELQKKQSDGRNASFLRRTTSVIKGNTYHSDPGYMKALRVFAIILVFLISIGVVVGYFLLYIYNYKRAQTLRDQLEEAKNLFPDSWDDESDYLDLQAYHIFVFSIYCLVHLSLSMLIEIIKGCFSKGDSENKGSSLLCIVNLSQFVASLGLLIVGAIFIFGDHENKYQGVFQTIGSEENQTFDDLMTINSINFWVTIVITGLSIVGGIIAICLKK